MHLYVCFLKLSQWSFSGDQIFLKLEIYDKFIFDFWMIVMIIKKKKKGKNNPQRLANTKEIKEKKRPWGGNICISPRMLLSGSVAIKIVRHDFEPRQSFDHFFVVSFSAIPLLKVFF